MKVVFTARRLNPGQYEGFRKAWEPERFPQGFQRAYIVRDTADPDVVIAFGLFDVSDERAEQLKSDLEPSERARHEAMAPYVAETLVSGLFDVVYSMEGSAEGAITIVPLTERHIKPGSMDDYRATMQEFAAAMGGPPPGMVADASRLPNTADPRPPGPARHPAHRRPGRAAAAEPRRARADGRARSRRSSRASGSTRRSSWSRSSALPTPERGRPGAGILPGGSVAGEERPWLKHQIETSRSSSCG